MEAEASSLGDSELLPLITEDIRTKENEVRCDAQLQPFRSAYAKRLAL